MLQLLGFPIQLFGLLLLPGTIVKYLVEKDDPSEDVRGALVWCCAASAVCTIPTVARCLNLPIAAEQFGQAPTWLGEGVILRDAFHLKRRQVHEECFKITLRASAAAIIACELMNILYNETQLSFCNHEQNQLP